MLDLKIMRLFKRENGIYYVEFKRGKKMSLKTKDKSEAIRLFNKLKRQYLEGKLLHLIKDGKNILFSTYLKEFLEWSESYHRWQTYYMNRHISNKFIQAVGDKFLSAYKKRDLDLYVQRLRQEKFKPSSINIHIRHIKAIFNKAVEWEYLQVNPFSNYKGVKQQEKPPRFLTKEEIKKIEQVIDDESLLFLFRFLIYTGARRGEALGLTYKDIDLKNNLITFKETKTYRSRSVPIHPVLREEFEKRKNNVGRVFPYRADYVTHKLKKYFIKAGLEDVRVHDLRHTFASQLAMNGVDLRTIQKLLGHTSYKTTEIYAHLAQEHLQNAVSKLVF